MVYKVYPRVYRLIKMSTYNRFRIEPGTIFESDGNFHVVQLRREDLLDFATYRVTTFYGPDFTDSSDAVVSFANGNMREHPPFLSPETDLGQGVRVELMVMEKQDKLSERLPLLMDAVEKVRKREISALRLYFGG